MSKRMTYEDYLERVKRVGNTLSSVPESFKTPELCLAAIERDGQNIEDVPFDLLTPELCLKAVKQDGLALYWVPDKLKTFEICFIAVTKNINVIEYVPTKMRAQIYTKMFIDSIKDKSIEQLLTDDDPCIRELTVFYSKLFETHKG